MMLPRVDGAAAFRPYILLAALLLTAPAAGCGRSPAPSPAKPAASAAPAALQEQVPAVSRLAAPKRIVALGDLHGDLRAARAALELAGAIDDKGDWSGRDLMVVQLGDEIDRGDDDRAVIDLFDRLGEQAKAAGGSVIALVGNHEIMNVEQRFDYVATGALAAFAGIAGIDPHDSRVAALPEPARARAAAFLPGAPYARILAKRPIAALVGGTVFVHGGILPKHLRYGLDRITREAAAWMNGGRPDPPRMLDAEDGPTWLRRYSAAPDAGDCAVLGETLAMLPAKRMVMGHTPQRGGISSACDERAWRVDVGMSAAYGGRPEVLAIEGDTVTVVRSP